MAVPFPRDTPERHAQAKATMLALVRTVPEQHIEVTADFFLDFMVTKHASLEREIGVMQTGDRIKWMKLCDDLVQTFHQRFEVMSRDLTERKFITIRPATWRGTHRLTEEEWQTCLSIIHRGEREVRPCWHAREVINRLKEEQSESRLERFMRIANNAMKVNYMQALVMRAKEEGIFFQELSNLEEWLPPRSPPGRHRSRNGL
ncbi:hypothetical protein EJ08DRAFT_661013 [Tothia fuscella]|uniref:Uncharacterized protein n=1 Tax=Tothia fuscella TaxID=1048955 RepID=A0A9P4NS75_9PEZI|nr:hypothetical protein EJ08DRAFT_661013 [Tothia fuscella]